VQKTAYLILENGRIFEGKSFGAEREALGELVFNTGMTGYLENLTSSSYYGQILLQTFPLIGNYGKISPDFESGSVKATAYIVKSWCEEPSNFRCEGNLDTFLKSENIPGLYGIDTREVTKIIRENGVMNCKLAYSRENIDFDEIKNYKIVQAVESVSCTEMHRRGFINGGDKYKVLLLDLGVKESIMLRLKESGCSFHIMPYNTDAERIKTINPDGILLSNGPGNPADNPEIIDNLKEIIKLGLPVFGIGLGHQLLALAHGFKTSKLKYGHRGANQPVKNLIDGRVYITNQNHGYTVEPDSIDENIAQVLFRNVNDNTCEGIEYKNKLMFSSEFYPEAFYHSAQNTSFLFDRFINSMGDVKNDD
jgi:carbamoyl-phosphate synthase small subunit